MYGILTQSIGQVFSYVPSFTGFSSDPTGVTAKYVKDGKRVTVIVNMTNGTSNATTFTMSAPFLSDSFIQNGVWSTATDNGVGITTSGRIRIASGTSTFDFYTNHTVGAWTGANGKGVSFTFTYFIA